MRAAPYGECDNNLGDLQNDDDPYGVMDRIEPGEIVLAREGTL